MILPFSFFLPLVESAVTWSIRMRTVKWQVENIVQIIFYYLYEIEKSN